MSRRKKLLFEWISSVFILLFLIAGISLPLRNIRDSIGSDSPSVDTPNDSSTNDEIKLDKEIIYF